MALSTIDRLISQLGMPPGYRRISWREVCLGRTVWLWGTCRGQPTAHGPFGVIDAERRQLENRRGQRFLHYPEDLLVPEAD